MILKIVVPISSFILEYLLDYFPGANQLCTLFVVKFISKRKKLVINSVSFEH